MQCSVKTRSLAMTVTVAALAAPLTIGVLNGSRLRAQAPQSNAAPAFEVASIKPNNSGDGRVMIGGQPGGRFTASNVPLKLLIRQAYQLQDFQIIGGPSWIASDRYDIVAKAEGPFTAGGGCLSSSENPPRRSLRAEDAFRNARRAGISAHRCERRAETGACRKHLCASRSAG